MSTEINIEQVIKYTNDKFNEQDSSDRIEDRGFAYYINTQPREYIATNDTQKMIIGNGPIVIIKATGLVYTFPSTPIYMFDYDQTRIGVNSATTQEKFEIALEDLAKRQDQAAMTPEQLESRYKPISTL